MNRTWRTLSPRASAWANWGTKINLWVEGAYPMVSLWPDSNIIRWRGSLFASSLGSGAFARGIGVVLGEARNPVVSPHFDTPTVVRAVWTAVVRSSVGAGPLVLTRAVRRKPRLRRSADGRGPGSTGRSRVRQVRQGSEHSRVSQDRNGQAQGDRAEADAQIKHEEEGRGGHAHVGRGHRGHRNCLGAGHQCTESQPGEQGSEGHREGAGFNANMAMPRAKTASSGYMIALSPCRSWIRPVKSRETEP